MPGFNGLRNVQAAFDELKHLLTTAPVLGYPLNQGNMILYTDASDVGIGAVLSQVQQDRERVLLGQPFSVSTDHSAFDG